MSGLVFNRGGGKMSPKLMAIIISRLPTKTEYIDGDIFDPSGMEVLAVYSDGTSTVCTGYRFSPDTALTVGQTRVTITYSEGGTTAQTTVTINVKPRLLSVRIVRAPTKTVYELGESFDPTPMLLEATYSDGSTKTIDQTQYRYPDAPLTTIGVRSIVISYEENGIRVSAFNSVWVYETIQIPTQNGTLVYNEALQTPVWNGYDANKMTLGGVTAAENAGTYMATFTPGMYLRWPDGSEEPVDVEWVIEKAPGSLSISPVSIELDMSNKTGTITVTRVGDGVITAVSDNTAAATASVSGTDVTVTGISNGRAIITVNVAAGTNHNAPTSEICTVTVNFLDETFADNSWETIIAACQSGSVPNSWKAGDRKPMSIGGTDYPIIIIGEEQDTYTAGGTAPLTFQMFDIYGTAYKMNSTNTNTGSWENCEMRKNHLPELFTLLPAEVQAGIKQVNKKTHETSSASSALITTADKLFMPSRYEAMGDGFADEGQQYAYYAAGNSLIKYRSGSAYIWWLRSLRGTAYFYAVDAAGESDYVGAGQSRGVAFCFCF